MRGEDVDDRLEEGASDIPDPLLLSRTAERLARKPPREQIVIRNGLRVPREVPFPEYLDAEPISVDGAGFRATVVRPDRPPSETVRRDAEPADPRKQLDNVHALVVP